MSRRSRENEFETELRAQIDDSGQKLEAATEVGHSFEAHLHSARLLDLLDRAHDHGIDTADWIDQDLLTRARESA